jgi:non-heme chloroperoxidase
MSQGTVRGQVAKAVLISSIPPTFMKSERNPVGVPKEVVDGIRDGTANHRSQFYKDNTIPFYGFNRPGAAISEGIRENWWRQGFVALFDCHRLLKDFVQSSRQFRWPFRRPEGLPNFPFGKRILTGGRL